MSQETRLDVSDIVKCIVVCGCNCVSNELLLWFSEKCAGGVDLSKCLLD